MDRIKADRRSDLPGICFRLTRSLGSTTTRSVRLFEIGVFERRRLLMYLQWRDICTALTSLAQPHTSLIQIQIRLSSCFSYHRHSIPWTTSNQITSCRTSSLGSNLPMSEAHEIHISLCSSRHDDCPVAGFTGQLSLLLSCTGKQRTITVSNPFSKHGERDYRWYLEDYAAKQPFAASRAAKVEKSLEKYGKALSDSLLGSGILPLHGRIKLWIDCSPIGGEDEASSRASSPLQNLHWELLEDISRWSNANYNAINVCRTLSISLPKVSSGTASTRVNILLVTCRPKGRDDIDGQLISRCILDAVQASNASLKTNRVRLEILRPPTWLAFKEHLLYDFEPGHYQIIHFDMHGEILRTGDSQRK